jgi:hypothetical protein
VQVLGVAVEPHPGVVPDQPHDRAGDRPANGVGGRCARRELGDGHLGRPRRTRSERADHRRRDLRGRGSRQEQPPRDRVEKTRGRPVGGHHLELAEPHRDPPAVEHRDLVVEDLGEHPGIRVAQLDPAPQRLQPRLPPENGGPDESADDVDGLVRWAALGARERELRGGQVLLAPGRQPDVQPSSVRCPRLTPHRASRRSSVS